MANTIVQLMLILTVLNPSYAEVRITNGRMEIVKYEKCNITNEEGTRELKEGKQSGYWFGLITYQCGKSYGYIISKVDCLDCGLYCTHNDYIEGCQNVVLQKAVGVVIGMLVGAIMSLALYLGLGRLLIKAWHEVIALCQARSDNRANKLADRIERSTMIAATPIYKNKFNVVSKQGKAYKHRRPEPSGIYTKKALTKVNNFEMDEFKKIDAIEPTSSMDLVKDHSSDTNNDTASTGSFKRTGSRKSLILHAPLFIIMIIGLNEASACDMNFYLKTNGKICNVENCYDINMYTFVISYGQVVCFTDVEGEITEYRIESAVERIRYNAIYKVSSFVMKTEDTWMCKRNDGCRIGECTEASVHSSFRNYTGLNGYGCRSTSSPCDTYCYFSSQCVYYHWNISPIGKQKIVYDVVSKMWEMTVLMKYKGTIRKAVMNVNNPSVNMEIVSLENKIMMPMYITGVDYEKESTPSKGIMVIDKMVMIEGSESNLPVGGSLGDYQLSLDGSTSIIDETMIRCQVESCKSTCISQEPAYTKVERNYERYRSSRVSRVMNNGMTVDTTRDIMPTINIGIGNVNYKNLFVRQSKCKVKLAMTFGCVACPVKPYAVFESMSIESEGIIPFESNCTFSRSYLSCSQTPYTINIEDGNEYCLIEIEKFNQSIIVRTDYKFLGKMTPTRSIIGKEDFRSIVGSIATSKAFYETVFQTITGCAIVSTVVTVTLKIARLYAVTKVQSTADVA